MSKNPEYPFNFDLEKTFKYLDENRPSYIEASSDYTSYITRATQSIVEVNKILKDFVDGKFIFTETSNSMKSYSINNLFSLWENNITENNKWNIGFKMNNSFIKLSNINNSINNNMNNINYDFLFFENNKKTFSIRPSNQHEAGAQIVKSLLEHDIKNIQLTFSEEIKTSYKFMIHISQLLSFYSQHNLDISAIIKPDTVYSRIELMKSISKNYDAIEMNQVIYDVDSTLILDNLKKLERSLTKNSNGMNKNEQ